MVRDPAGANPGSSCSRRCPSIPPRTFQSRRLVLGGETKASGKASRGSACGHGCDAAPSVEPAAASVDEAQPQGISPKLLGSAVGAASAAGAAGAAADAKRASRSRPGSKLRATGRWEARADGGTGGAEEGVGGMRTGDPSQHEAEQEREAGTGVGIMSSGLEIVLPPLTAAGSPSSSSPPAPRAAPSPSPSPSLRSLPSKSRLLPISDSRSPVATTGVAACNLAPGAAHAAAWARCAAAYCPSAGACLSSLASSIRAGAGAEGAPRPGKTSPARRAVVGAEGAPTTAERPRVACERSESAARPLSPAARPPSERREPLADPTCGPRSLMRSRALESAALARSRASAAAAAVRSRSSEPKVGLSGGAPLYCPPGAKEEPHSSAAPCGGPSETCASRRSKALSWRAWVHGLAGWMGACHQVTAYGLQPQDTARVGGEARGGAGRRGAGAPRRAARRAPG